MISINKINQIFERFGSLIIRLRYAVVAVFILALVFGGDRFKKNSDRCRLGQVASG